MIESIGAPLIGHACVAPGSLGAPLAQGVSAKLLLLAAFLLLGKAGDFFFAIPLLAVNYATGFNTKIFILSLRAA